jgi:hypothetical protein
MKKISIVLCVLLLIACLTGCGAAGGEYRENTHPDSSVLDMNNLPDFVGFECVGFVCERGATGEHSLSPSMESYIWCYYLRDKLTDVMYVWRTSWSGGMTVLMNPQTNGPLVYSDWVEMLEQAQGKCGTCGFLFSDNKPAFCPECGAAVNNSEEEDNG